jgi:hypothetical protein
MESSAHTNFNTIENGTSFHLWDPPAPDIKYWVEFANGERTSFTVLRASKDEFEIQMDDGSVWRMRRATTDDVPTPRGRGQDWAIREKVTP